MPELLQDVCKVDSSCKEVDVDDEGILKPYSMSTLVSSTRMLRQENLRHQVFLQLLGGMQSSGFVGLVGG